MKQDLIKFALIPGIVCAGLTWWRYQLEVTDPDGPMTQYVSVSILTLLLVFAIIWYLRHRKMGHFLLVLLVALLLVRIPIGLAYASSWENKTTVQGTTEPVRYVTDILTEAEKMGQDPAEIKTAFVAAGTTLFPVAFGMVIGLVGGLLLRWGNKNRRGVA